MLRTYDFYKRNYKILEDEIDFISDTINQFENGVVNEKALRNLGLNGLIFCIAESKIDTLNKLIAPIGVEKDGIVEYKYYMDAISLDLPSYIKSLPSSIMDKYAQLVRQNNNDVEGIKVESFINDLVILTQKDRESINKVLYDINMGAVSRIKIKDVHARQISGMGHAIRSKQDVAYYSEISNYLPCLYLFNNNIATTSNDTIGCVDDVPTKDCKCEISISYDYLSEENKCVADSIVESGNGYFIRSFLNNGKDLMITIPCGPDETILDVNKRFMKLIGKFTKQDVLHGVVSPERVYNGIVRCGTFLDMDKQEKVFDLFADGVVTNQILADALVYYDGIFSFVYDSEEDKFYTDPLIYARHKEYLAEFDLKSGDESVTI